MIKKDFTNAGALPQEPTSEEVFSSMIGGATPTPQQPTAKPKSTKGRKANGHKCYCLWLTPNHIEGARVLAKAKDIRLSAIVEEALSEYLSKPEHARTIRKYKRLFLEEAED